MELLRHRAAFNERYLELEADAGLNSRMQGVPRQVGEEMMGDDRLPDSATAPSDSAAPVPVWIWRRKSSLRPMPPWCPEHTA